MKKLLGSFVLCAALVAICTPEVMAQRDGKQGDKQGARNQDRQQKGKRRRGRRMRRPDDAPKIGDIAPTFKLKSLDGDSETDIAKFKGKKPVVLFFGSYT